MDPSYTCVDFEFWLKRLVVGGDSEGKSYKVAWRRGRDAKGCSEWGQVSNVKDKKLGIVKGVVIGVEERLEGIWLPKTGEPVKPKALELKVFERSHNGSETPLKTVQWRLEHNPREEGKKKHGCITIDENVSLVAVYKVVQSLNPTSMGMRTVSSFNSFELGTSPSPIEEEPHVTAFSRNSIAQVKDNSTLNKSSLELYSRIHSQEVQLQDRRNEVRDLRRSYASLKDDYESLKTDLENRDITNYKLVQQLEMRKGKNKDLSNEMADLRSDFRRIQTEEEGKANARICTCTLS